MNHLRRPPESSIQKYGAEAIKAAVSEDIAISQKRLNEALWSKTGSEENLRLNNEQAQQHLLDNEQAYRDLAYQEATDAGKHIDLMQPETPPQEVPVHVNHPQQ